MKNSWKRLLSLLVVLALLMGIMPEVFAAGTRSAGASSGIKVYTEEENETIENDVFAKIYAIENGFAERNCGFGAMTQADYAALVPAVIEAIESSETYAEGTLQRNGDFLVWQTTIGIPCCYDPRMEALLRSSAAPSEEEVMQAEKEAEALGAALREALEEAGTRYVGNATSLNIGLIQPYWESNTNYADPQFRNWSPYYKSTWQALTEATGGTGYRYSMTNANINNIADTIENCGLVIFDSHGTTDYASGTDYTSYANSSYLCLTTSSGITSMDTTPKTGPYDTYYDCMKGSGYAYVNGACIANHMDQNAPNSLVYMGICLGMATDKMFTGLRGKGVETVYGYSQSVTFSGEKAYMVSIMGYIQNEDTFASALSKTKAALGDWDPAYSSYSLSQAISNRVAFPIAVSSEDTYPGHGYVDNVQTVYSTWTLFPTYKVTAVSNNTSYGTVSVSGRTITAAPNTGYYAAGYTVLSGTASVAQDGNIFTVSPSSDCTVRIDFAPRATVTVSCLASGEDYSDITAYQGDDVTLPSTAPAVSGWDFIGWSAVTVPETTQTPAYFAPGASVTASSDLTFHALYSCVDQSSGPRYVYELLTSAPSDWSGDYVITGDTSASWMLRGLAGNENSYEDAGNGGSVTLAASGASLNGTVLSNVNDRLVFTFAHLGTAYSIRNKATGTYVANRGGFLMSLTSLSNSYCRWNPSKNGTAVNLSNTANSDYPYLSFSTDGIFFMNDTVSPVYLWKARENTDLTVYYATSPTAHQPEEPVEFGLEAELVLGGVQLSYPDAPDDAFSYEILRRLPGGDWETVGQAFEKTYVDQTVDVLTTYEYQVVVTDGASDVAEITTGRFLDVLASDSYNTAVNWAVEHGIVNGTSSTTFSPKDACTRAQFALMLYRLAGKPAVDMSANPFTDLPNNAGIRKAIVWAYNAGIVNGTSATTFSPDANITRAQLTLMLYKMAGKPKVDGLSCPFEDLDGLTGNNLKAILWAYNNNIVKGTGTTTFSPKANCTRGQLVIMLYRFNRLLGYIPASAGPAAGTEARIDSHLAA